MQNHRPVTATLSRSHRSPLPQGVVSGLAAARRWATLAGLVALSATSAVITKQLLAGGASGGVPPALTVLTVPDEADALGGAMLADEPEWLEAAADSHQAHAQSQGRADAEGSVEAEGYIDDTSVRFFDGRPVRPARTMTMIVTAYSPDERSCGDSADGITASLHHVQTNDHRLVAADRRVLPLGSMLTVPGYDGGAIVPVLDVGGAIKGRRLDVLFPTHEQARRWGVRRVNVTVWEYADGLPPTDWRRVRDSRRAASR